MRVLAVIPARLGSTRLPNKPLQLLAGEPLITRVIQRVLEHGLTDEVIVATDSPMIAEVVQRSQVRAVLTGDSHLTGTDRVAEAAARREFAAYDVIVNVQGDEPFVSREALAGAIDRLELGDDIGTAAAPLDPGLAADPVAGQGGHGRAGQGALFLACHRFPTGASSGEPADGLYWQHVGIYAYTRPALSRWVSRAAVPGGTGGTAGAAPGVALRLRIGVTRLEAAALPGVDTLEDLRRAEAHWHALQGVGL